MASFQSKIRRRRPRKRENENYCSDSKKNSKKIQKIKKNLYGFISSKNRLEKAAKERK